MTGKCLCTFLFPNEIHSICASSFSTTIYCGTDTGVIFVVPLRTLTTQVNWLIRLSTSNLAFSFHSLVIINIKIQRLQLIIPTPNNWFIISIDIEICERWRFVKLAIVSSRGAVISLRLSGDEQLLYSGSLDKDCAMWDLSSGQVRFKKSCSSTKKNTNYARFYPSIYS